jgi:hypothetical protein
VRKALYLGTPVLAWGVVLGRWASVAKRAIREVADGMTPARALYRLGEPTKDGEPQHPLMLPAATPLVPWRDQ